MFVSRSLQIGQNSQYAKEICKWEANYTQYGEPGRPYEYRAYPTMMYRPKRIDGGVTFEGQIAESETERSNLESQGFVWGGQAAALVQLEQLETMMATAAAERAFADRKMTDRAQAEADAKDSRTVQHLGEIPADPLPPKRTRIDTK